MVTNSPKSSNQCQVQPDVIGEFMESAWIGQNSCLTTPVKIDKLIYRVFQQSDCSYSSVKSPCKAGQEVSFVFVPSSASCCHLAWRPAKSRCASQFTDRQSLANYCCLKPRALLDNLAISIRFLLNANVNQNF